MIDSGLVYLLAIFMIELESRKIKTFVFCNPIRVFELN